MLIFEESQPGRAARAQLPDDVVRDLDLACVPGGAGGSKARAA